MAQKYTDGPANEAIPAEQAALDAAWGKESGTRTLVLYDTAGSASDIEDAETQAILAANLATHFGQVQTAPMEDYLPAQMDSYDGVVYVGATGAGVIPVAFHNDLLKGRTPVLWAGANVGDRSAENPEVQQKFLEMYGWDPVAMEDSGSGAVTGVEYRSRILTRNGKASGPIMVPDVVDPAKVTVLARTTSDAALPWAIRSGNLTFIGENPLTYVNETNRYPAFADLYFDLLAPNTTMTKRAAVRLEDVDASANPDDLRAITDFLVERDIPFQVAVIPIRISTSTDQNSDAWIGLSLADRPEVVKELRYMQEHGGTLIQHGTTHQYGKLDNPYSSASGADFEFYRAECSATAGPTFEIEPCVNNSHIVDTEPVGPDSVQGWVTRLKDGRQVFEDLGLGVVDIFETPHYLASANAYAAMSEVFEYRYERSHYFPGQLSNASAPYQRAMDQLFPFSVHDIYGATVLPENLGNITEEEQNNHAIRDPAFIISGAEANLAVRESTASFFYHPFLGVDPLRETIDGIEDLGYIFVPATELE